MNMTCKVAGYNFYALCLLILNVNKGKGYYMYMKVTFSDFTHFFLLAFQ